MSLVEFKDEMRLRRKTNNLTIYRVHKDTALDQMTLHNFFSSPSRPTAHIIFTLADYFATSSEDYYNLLRTYYGRVHGED